jgi:hypothetical protein
VALHDWLVLACTLCQLYICRQTWLVCLPPAAATVGQCKLEASLSRCNCMHIGHFKALKTLCASSVTPPCDMPLPRTRLHFVQLQRAVARIAYGCSRSRPVTATTRTISLLVSDHVTKASYQVIKVQNDMIAVQIAGDRGLVWDVQGMRHLQMSSNG